MVLVALLYYYCLLKVGLNFANAHHAGGGYLRGARAQEEDLCRLMPTLYTALKRLAYPLAEDQAHYSLQPHLLWPCLL